MHANFITKTQSLNLAFALQPRFLDLWLSNFGKEIFIYRLCIQLQQYHFRIHSYCINHYLLSICTPSLALLLFCDEIPLDHNTYIVFQLHIYSSLIISLGVCALLNPIQANSITGTNETSIRTANLIWDCARKNIIHLPQKAEGVLSALICVIYEPWELFVCLVCGCVCLCGQLSEWRDGGEGGGEIWFASITATLDHYPNSGAVSCHPQHESFSTEHPVHCAATHNTRSLYADHSSQ